MYTYVNFTVSGADETVSSMRAWSTWVYRQHVLRSCTSELEDSTKPAAGGLPVMVETQMDKSDRNTCKTAQ